MLSAEAAYSLAPAFLKRLRSHAEYSLPESQKQQNSQRGDAGRGAAILHSPGTHLEK